MFKKSVPYVQQMQDTECGLCCVSMILKYYSLNVSMSYLKNNFEIGRDGLSAREIGQIFDKFNFKVDYYKSNVEGLRGVAGSPLILFWDNMHFVVLEKIVKDKYHIIDPRIGKEVLSKEEMVKHFTNFIIRPLASEKIEKKKYTSKEDHIYYSFFRANKFKAFILIVLSLLAYLVALSAPAILQKVIDDIVKGASTLSDEYLKIVFLIMILYAGLSFIKSIRTISFSKLMDEYTYKSVINKLFTVPFNFFLTRNSSDLLYRLTLLKSNRNFLVDKLISSIFNISNLLILLAIMISMDIKIFFLVLILSILSCLILFPPTEKTYAFNKKIYIP